jgi:hypothetical protein
MKAFTQEEGRIIAQSQFDVNEEIWKKFPATNFFQMQRVHAVHLNVPQGGGRCSWL